MKAKATQLIQPLLLISAFLCSFSSFAQVNTPPDSLNKGDSAQLITGDTIIEKPLSSSPFNSEVKFKAKDSIFIDMVNKKVYLYGEAEVYYEKLELKAARITIDFTTSELIADFVTDSSGKKMGVPNFKDGEQAINADAISYSFKTKRAKIRNLVMKEGEGIIYGAKVKKDQFDNIYVGDATYTTCDAEHPHFYIHSARMKIVPGKQVITGPANLVVADVPTPAWIPFGFFPVQKGRKSGIIMPGYGFSVGQGYFLRNGGYYFGVSDYFDLALTGDAFTQGSWAIRGASTYAKRYKYSGNVQVAFTRNKRGDREDPTNYLDERNYNIIWTHRMDPKARPNTNFGASVNYQSPRYQQLNAYNPANIVQSAVYSSINYNKVMGGGKYSLGLTGTASQNNQTKDVNLILPQLTFDVLRFFPFQRKLQSGNKRWYEEIGINYSFNAQNNISTKDSLLLRPQTLQQMQNGAVHRASVSTQFKVFKYFSLNPSISANEYWYLQTINRTWNQDSMRVETDTVRGFSRTSDFNVNANLSTIIYGMYRINGKKLQAIRHVMNVTANVGFHPDFSDADFGNYRKVQSDTNGNEQLYSIYEKGIFNGPGQGRAGQVGLSLNNNLEMKVRKYGDTGYTDEKIKIFETFAISSNYNFFAEQFKLAPVTMSARTTLFKQVTVNINGVTFDPYALDSAGRRKNVYLVKENGKLARFTNGSMSLSTSLNSKMFDGKKDAGDEGAPQPGVSSLRNSALAYNPNLTAYELSLLSSIGDFADFDVPWSLTLNFNYNYSRPGKEKTINQNVTFSGDMNLTQNWKIAFSSGYDFTRKQVNLTSIDFYRQLHCWEFKFSWVPLGFRQYFLFNLNVKSSVLKDLKINRRRDWYDQH